MSAMMAGLMRGEEDTRLPLGSAVSGLGVDAGLASNVCDAPAPWAIEGRGFLSLLRFDSGFLDDDPFVPPALAGRRLPGRLGVMMFVDYAATPAGPYRELLFIPGRYELGGVRFRSISRIFVSTMDSVVNGRRNWGIPKDLAEFEIERGKRSERVRIAAGGKVFADLEFQRTRLSLPVTTATMPAPLRRLGQVLGGRHFLLSPSARGRAGLASLSSATVDPLVFPDIGQGIPLVTAEITQFRMTFPDPTVIRMA